MSAAEARKTDILKIEGFDLRCFEKIQVCRDKILYITRELLAVVLAVHKFKRLLIGRDLVIRLDGRALMGLFKKPLLSIENEDLREFVAQVSQFLLLLEYFPGPRRKCPYWQSRKCVVEIYYYQDHRMSDEKAIEVLRRGNWNKFTPAQDGWSLLFSWNTRFHRGHGRMFKAAEDMNFTCPNILEGIREFPSIKRSAWNHLMMLVSDEDSGNFEVTFLCVARFF
jgi:hypothetical protein